MTAACSPARASVLLATLTLLACPAAAQPRAAAGSADALEPRMPAETALRSAWWRGASLELAPDAGGRRVPVARGTMYRAEFARGGMQFLPALGRAAPRDLPFGLTLLGVDRDGSAGRGLPLAAEWTVDGLRVAAARDACEERYDVREDGVEHSVVLHRLPAGAGDLIVRLAVDTELLPVGCDRSAESLRWEWPQIGGVQVGAVTAIDADGRRVPGSLRRTTAGELHYVVPARFVESATLPLTIDPLIGSTRNIMASASADAQPDIAFNRSASRYLVVWTRTFSLLSAEIRGRMLDENADLTGPSIVNVSTGGVVNQNPKVAAIESTDSFVVAWEHSALVGTAADVWARGVRATDGRLTINTQRLTTSSSIDDAEIDVGGETGTDDEALVVWRSQGNLIGAQVNINPTSNACNVLGLRTVLDLSDDLSNPSISTRNDRSDHRLLAYERQRLSKSVDVQLVNSSLVPVGFPLIVRSQSGVDCLDPDVDGDGLDWVVAYEIEEAPGRGSFDIECRPYSLDQTTTRLFAAALPQLVEGGSNDDEYDPAVAWGENTALIGYADADTASVSTIFLSTFDPYSCAACEPRQAAFAFDGAGHLALAWGPSSSGLGTDSLAVWEHSGSNGNIAGRLWSADHGRSFERIDGCGTTTTRIVAGCPRAGNPAFRIEARGLPANQPVFLLASPTSFRRALDNCGGCVLLPYPFDSLIVGGTSDARGRHAVSAPLPAGPLPNLYVQWLWPGPSCPLWSVDTSVGLEISRF